MRLSIFARLIISYLLLFSMLAGVSLFFIYHLNQFNQTIQSIILNDTAVLELSNQLSDSLLAETRFDRKYVIFKDDQLYDHYLEAKNDFDLLLTKTATRAPSPGTDSFLTEIESKHQYLSRLIEEERDHIKGGKQYSSDWYGEEKNRVANEILTQLKHTQQESENIVSDKIRTLSEMGNRVGNVAIIITAISLVTGLVISIIITRSITGPLTIIKKKTREIAEGNFQGNIEIKSPPTIRDLAEAINNMCHRLQEVETIKSNFFSHMSHELRTPLTSIKEGTKLLLDGLGGEISEKQQKILSIIGQESDRMISLVNSLLDLAKMEAGMTAYHFSQTNLVDLINETIRALMPLAEAKSITVNSSVTSLPSIDVDREKILLVFRNILGNAIKFTEQSGQISIKAAITDDFIEISFHDSGIGIPQQDLERIFLKFQQIIPTKGPGTPGTGLGLATVKQIIIAHGGKVWATSQEHQGSTFHVSLPLSA